MFSISEPPGTLQGTVVIIPGLNFRSKAFSDLAYLLSNAGCRSHILQLSGHDGHRSSRLLASAAQWKRDVLDGIASAHSASPEVPLHVVAFSLGGLLASCLIGSGQLSIVSRMILLAPALTLRTWTRLPRALALLPLARMPLPSLLPRRYRAADVIAGGWYQALFELEDEVSRPDYQQFLASVPSLILLSPRDEYVAASTLRTWVAQRQLLSWRVEELPPFGLERTFSHHFIVDQATLGPQRWDLVTNKLLTFLELSPT